MAGDGIRWCWHCDVRPGDRWRSGLCRECFHNDEVRTKRKATFGSHRGHGQTAGKVLPHNRAAFVPTQAAPGSEEKIAVLEWRAANGLPLWHPEDAVDKEHRKVGITCC